MKECQNLIGARVIIYMLMGRWEQSSRVAYAGETGVSDYSESSCTVGLSSDSLRHLSRDRAMNSCTFGRRMLRGQRHKGNVALLSFKSRPPKDIGLRGSRRDVILAAALCRRVDSKHSGFPHTSGRLSHLIAWASS